MLMEIIPRWMLHSFVKYFNFTEPIYSGQISKNEEPRLKPKFLFQENNPTQMLLKGKKELIEAVIVKD